MKSIMNLTSNYSKTLLSLIEYFYPGKIQISNEQFALAFNIKHKKFMENIQYAKY